MRSSSHSTRVIGQVFPWDLADGPARATLLREAGVTDVAIAASYHAVRALHWTNDLTPNIVHEVSSSYFPRVDSFTSTESLHPTRSTTIEEGTYERAVRNAHDAGLGVRPWLVLTHCDESHAVTRPELATVDAWGNRSRYALCPSQPAVQDYCRLLVSEAVKATGAREVFVESLSAPGFIHSLSHDKLAHSRLGPLDEHLLLSLCCCSACSDEARRDDWDPEELSRELVGAFGHPTLSERTEIVVGRALATRDRVTGELAERLAAPVEGIPIELTVAATCQPSAFGAFASVPAWQHTRIGLCADLSAPDGNGRLDLEEWASRGDGRRAGTIQVGNDSLQTCFDRARMTPEARALLDDLYLYHLGMRNPASLDGLRIDSALNFDSQGNS